MTTALNRYIAEHSFRRVVLIGYSGGGALSMLITPRVHAVTSVITIAGVLDGEAWAHSHEYLPLDASLDPATEKPLPQSIEQRHLVGGQDTNVAPAINAPFLDSLPTDDVWLYASFDHVCCWVEQWPDIFERIERDLRTSRDAQSATRNDLNSRSP